MEENQKPSVILITPTCGRIRCLRRALALFIEQDYTGEHTMLIFNNSDMVLTLRIPELPPNKHVTLINSHVNSVTGNRYTSLGEIQNDMLNFIPDTIDIVNGFDDDDLILKDHITEGVKGYLRCGKLAYKPKQSWFKHPGGVELMENTMEPSIFVNAKFLKEIGYDSSKNTQHHLTWVHELLRLQEICSDPEGKPTLIYTWGTDAIYKTSGAGETANNFDNYRAFSQDFDDCIVKPAHRITYIDLLSVPNA